MATMAGVLDQRVELNFAANEREEYDNRQTMYSLIRQLEFLEKAFAQGVFQTPQDETKYGEECDKLLRQYKQAVQWLGPTFELEAFMKEHDVQGNSLRVVLSRIKSKVNGLVENGRIGGNEDKGMDTAVVVDVTTGFIMVSDTVAMDMRSVDQLQPQVSKLLEALNKLPKLPADYPAKTKMRGWLQTMDGMRADEELDEAQGRQLTFDIQTELTNFRATAATF